MDNESPEQVAPAKSKVTAGLLAIFLGGLGAHRFYLKRLDGIAYLLLSLIGLWVIVFPFCIVQGIYYLFVSNERWARIAAPQTPGQLRTSRRRLIVGASVGVVLLVGLVFWLIDREQQALADAHAFCDAVAIGDPIAPIKARADGLGERMLRIISDEEVAVGFVGIPPFSRHLCTVRAKDGIVIEARYFYLD